MKIFPPTPAVACVLANWDNVLRAISMASSKSSIDWAIACPDFIIIIIH